MLARAWQLACCENTGSGWDTVGMGMGPSWHHLALCFLGSHVQGTLLELGHLIPRAAGGDSISSWSHWRVFLKEPVLKFGEECVNGKWGGL